MITLDQIILALSVILIITYLLQLILWLYLRLNKRFQYIKSQRSLEEAFKDNMIQELLANNHKGDWRTWDNHSEMWHELLYHQDKLEQAIAERNLEGIKEYSADCANILMMISNKFKVL